MWLYDLIGLIIIIKRQHVAPSPRSRLEIKIQIVIIVITNRPTILLLTVPTIISLFVTPGGRPLAPQTIVVAKHLLYNIVTPDTLVKGAIRAFHKLRHIVVV